MYSKERKTGNELTIEWSDVLAGWVRTGVPSVGAIFLVSRWPNVSPLPASDGTCLWPTAEHLFFLIFLEENTGRWAEDGGLSLVTKGLREIVRSPSACVFSMNALRGCDTFLPLLTLTSWHTVTAETTDSEVSFASFVGVGGGTAEI